MKAVVHLLLHACALSFLLRATLAATVTVQWGLSVSNLQTEISVGDSVTWTLSLDGSSHTVTFSPASGLGISSGGINPGGSFTATFNQAGSFSYACDYHPSMTGTIVVSQGWLARSTTMSIFNYPSCVPMC